jgi:hypothetical protein
VSWTPSDAWLDIHDLAGAMHTKEYSTADRLAWVAASLRCETFEALAEVLPRAPD